MITLVVTDSETGTEAKFAVNDEDFYSTAQLPEGSMIVRRGDDDVEILVPAAYNHVVDNYVSWLQHQPIEVTNVTDWLSGFDLSMYFRDSSYKLFLMQQLLLHWSAQYGGLEAVLSQLQQNPNWLKEVNLYLPFNLVPDDLKLDPVFVGDWRRFTTKTANSSVPAGRTILDSAEYSKEYIMDHGTRIIIATVIEYKEHVYREIFTSAPRVKISFMYAGRSIISQTTDHRRNQVAEVSRDYQLDKHHILYDFTISGSGVNLREETSYILSGGTKIYDGLTQEWDNKGQLTLDTDYKNGKQVFMARYKNGQLNGGYESYLANGDVEAQGIYEFGERVGRWKLYEEPTNTYLTVNYINGIRSGPAEISNKRGVKFGGGQYVDDQRQGPWREKESELSPGVVTVSSGFYDRDRKVGRWVTTNFKTKRELRYDDYDRTGNLVSVTDL